MADLVVLSPHLDDAVISLGGTIARAVDEGREVEVVSFFTDAPAPELVPEKLRVFADYQARRAEDTAALARLGAHPRWIGLIERAFSEPHLTAFGQVFHTPDSVEGFPNLDRMQDVIEAVLRDNPGAMVRAPLGVGHHFDHVEVFVAAARALVAADAWDRLSFYEDPYAIGRRMREQHFVTRGHGWGRLGGPDTVSPRFWGMVRFMAFSRRGPGVEHYLPAELRDASWTAKRDPIDDARLERKLEAFACYPSQVEALGGLGDWGGALERYHRFWGDAEPRWVVAR